MKIQDTPPLLKTNLKQGGVVPRNSSDSRLGRAQVSGPIGTLIFTDYLRSLSGSITPTFYRVSNTCVQMPDSGLFRAFRLVFWVVSHPTRPLRYPRTEQNCLRPRKRPSVLQTVFYLALENFLFRSVMKLLGFSRIDAPDEVFVETP